MQIILLLWEFFFVGYFITIFFLFFSNKFICISNKFICILNKNNNKIICILNKFIYISNKFICILNKNNNYLNWKSSSMTCFSLYWLISGSDPMRFSTYAYSTKTQLLSRYVRWTTEVSDFGSSKATKTGWHISQGEKQLYCTLF